MSRPRSTNRPPVQTNGRQRQSLNPDQKSTVNEKKIVGHYVLGKTIGEGTFGKVKLAVHLPTGEKVAVKVLEKSRIKDQADLRRVNREIKILKRSRHDNIIQLYEVLDTQNSIYLIMEFAEGGEMFDYIVKHKHVEERQACNFFHQIVDGVEVLHQNFITHRDLKPENLLLKNYGYGYLLKIVDFGLSNTHEGGKLLATACGSPCYAAPEMIAGKQYEGPLVDIWSMGVILFALVCGFLPFEDQNTSNLYRKILAGEYKAAKWISNEVRDLIRKILETEPKKRFRLSDIRKHPWFTQVPENEIPRENISSHDSDIINKETLKSVSQSGADVNLVLDNVATKACNSLTATYYLFQQKHRNQKLKDNKSVEIQKNALSDNSSMTSSVPDSDGSTVVNEPMKPREPSSERPSNVRDRAVPVKLKSDIENKLQAYSEIGVVNNPIQIDNNDAGIEMRGTSKVSTSETTQANKMASNALSINQIIKNFAGFGVVPASSQAKSPKANLSILRHQHQQYADLILNQSIPKSSQIQQLDKLPPSVEPTQTAPKSRELPQIESKKISAQILQAVTTNVIKDAKSGISSPIVTKPAYSALKEVKPVNLAKLNVVTVSAPETKSLVVADLPQPNVANTYSVSVSVEPISSIPDNIESTDMTPVKEPDRPSTRRSQQRSRHSENSPDSDIFTLDYTERPSPGLGEIPIEPLPSTCDNMSAIHQPKSPRKLHAPIEPTDINPTKGPVTRRGRMLVAAGNKILNDLASMPVAEAVCATNIDQSNVDGDQRETFSLNDNVAKSESPTGSVGSTDAVGMISPVLSDTPIEISA